MKTLVVTLAGVIALSILGCASKDGASGASAARQKALDAVKRQDWDAAISQCGEAIRLDPKNVDAWWLRGLAHLKKKAYAEAVEDCTEAIKRDDKYHAAYRERGLALHGQKKYAQAIEDFTTFVGLKPDDPEGFEFRALAHSKNGDNAAASADLRAAEKLRKQQK